MARKIYSAYSAAVPLIRHELLPIPEVWIHQDPTENNLDYERASVTFSQELIPKYPRHRL